MSVKSVISVRHLETASVMNDKWKTGTSQPKKQAQLLADYFTSLASDFSQATFDLQWGGGDSVASTGVITFSGANTANDTVILNGTTFTCVASGATGNQWNAGTSGATAATNLVSALNASASVNALIVASDNGAGVLTITANYKGVLGNAITLAKGTDAGVVMTVSGLSGGRLSGGVQPTANAYACGISL